MSKHKIAVFGAGKIGYAIAALLTRSNRYDLKICDVDSARAQEVAAKFPNTAAAPLNLDSPGDSLALLSDVEAVVSALPFSLNIQVASLAVEANVHYFDLTEDRQTTLGVKEIAKHANCCLMPQCGLAPGFISICAGALVKLFDEIDTVKLRVGALPIYPSNRLKYNLTWSTAGLVNEYCNLCDVIVDHKHTQAFPLEGRESFSLDGDEYEAFNTSGGIGSLWETLEGKARMVDYKSVRYPGHCELIRFLLHDLRLRERQELLCELLEQSVTTTAQDKCLILVEVRGQRGGQFEQKTYASTVYHQEVGGAHLGAIQVTTAAGVCAPLDLLLQGKLGTPTGIFPCESIELAELLKNEFGAYYKDQSALAGIAD